MAESFTPLTTANLGGSISSITSAIDSNFSSIKTLLNDVISRQGVNPNTMTSNLDLNNNNILNLPYPATSASPLRLKDVVTGTNVGVAGPPGPAGPLGPAGPQGPPGVGGVASSINLSGNIVYTNSLSGPNNGGGSFWSNNGGSINALGTLSDPPGKSYLSQYHITDNVNANSSNNLTSFSFLLDSNGSSVQGGRSTLETRFNLRTKPADTNGQYGPFNAYSTAFVNVGGTSSTSTAGSLFGGNSYAAFQSGATFWNQLVGYEIDLEADAGTSMQEIIGMQLGMTANTNPTLFRNSSIAYAASNGGIQGTVVGFDYAFCDGNYAGNPCLKTTGTLLGCITNQMKGTQPTIAYGIDLNNYAAITGAILRGPQNNGSIDGNFNITVGSITSSKVPVNFGVLYNSGNSSSGPVTAGTGYVAGDRITLTGGTFTNAAVISVVSVSAGGVISAYQVINPGRYTIIPANPVVQGSTSGVGVGATFNLSWGVIASTLDGASLSNGSGNFFLGGTQNPGISATGELAGGYCTGSESTFVGCRAGSFVTTGNNNTAVGHNAIGNGGGVIGVTGGNNCAVGTDAMRNTISCGNIVAMGVSAHRNPSATNFNVAIGTQAIQGQASTTGGSNVAIGYQAMLGTNMTTAANTVAIGANVLKNVTSGLNGVYIGLNTGQGITSGSQNSIVGATAFQNSTGGGNTVLGFQALNAATSGNNNTIIGNQVGSTTLLTGSNNILIGTASNTDTSSSSTSNTFIVGCTTGTVPWLTGSLVAASPNAQVGGPVGTVAYTVSTLPAASATYKGMVAYVTDATAPTYLGTLTGGGSVVCPVFCNGTAWVST